MKKQIILSSAALALFASVASAQTVINLAENGRFQATYSGTYDVDAITGAAIFTAGLDSFAGGNAGMFKWAQIGQFDITLLADQTAFNNATEFELSLSSAPTQSYELYVSTKQLKEVSVGASTDDVMGQPSGSGAVDGYLQDTVARPVADRTATLLGTYSGAQTITSSASLNSLLSGTTFDATTSYVYIFALPSTDGAFESASFAGSSLNAVPEPSTYALLASCLALASVMVRRRR